MSTPDKGTLAECGWRHASHMTRAESGSIDLWLLLCADFAAHRRALLHCLSPQENQRAQRKKIPAKQFEYILGQAALRCLLAHNLAIPHAEVSYLRGPKGKPALDPTHHHQQLHFNISHSTGVILVALSTAGEIGIDVEGINTHTSIDLVSRRAFSEREISELQNQPEARRRDRFFQLWTCKEAVVKCTGDGIHSGMNKFSVQFPHSKQVRISEAHGPQEKTREFSITPLSLGPTHKGALVCADKFNNLRHHNLMKLPCMGNNTVIG